MTPEAIARDRETIRRMNQDQLAYVRRRDAGYAQGWNDYAAARGDPQAVEREARSSRRRDDPQSEYAEALRQWRADVRACQAGYYERCAER